MISVRSLGELIVVVNTAKAAQELFEKRSSIHSSRPYLAMADLCVRIYAHLFPLTRRVGPDGPLTLGLCPMRDAGKPVGG